MTVVSSSGTTFKSGPGPSGGTTSSAAALKVGDFIGVQGTKNSDGSVTASTVYDRPAAARWVKDPRRRRDQRAARPPSGGAPTA